MPRHLVAIALALAAATPALAAPEPQIYRLSPAERDAAIAAASQRTETDALLPDPDRDHILGSSLYASDAPRKPEVHGEVGAFIGSGGARGVFGTIGAELGENVFAQFSFEQSRLPAFQYRPYRWQQQAR